MRLFTSMSKIFYKRESFFSTNTSSHLFSFAHEKIRSTRQLFINQVKQPYENTSLPHPKLQHERIGRLLWRACTYIQAMAFAAPLCHRPAGGAIFYTPANQDHLRNIWSAFFRSRLKPFCFFLRPVCSVCTGHTGRFCCLLPYHSRMALVWLSYGLRIISVWLSYQGRMAVVWFPYQGGMAVVSISDSARIHFVCSL